MFGLLIVVHVIISAGFKETGKDGKLLEDQVAAIAKKYGVRLIGPNCVGMINVDQKISLNASFTKGMPKYGNIALVSQSGAICGAMLEYARVKNIGFSKVFSLGNKADVNENDILMMLANDASTKVILMYIEDLADGRKFIEIDCDKQPHLFISPLTAAQTNGKAIVASQ